MVSRHRKASAGRLAAVGRRIGGRAAGAVSGQLSQALASFGLQLLAARMLGARGLGIFALLYSGVVVGTAVVSGFVGDSLTVLDRRDRPIRAALQNWCLLLATLSGGVAALLAWASGLVGGNSALIFGLAVLVFIVEDTVRRLLMANMRFWALPLVDLSALVASLVVLGVAWLGPGPDLADFLLALLVGQVAGAVVGVLALPTVDRRLVPVRPAAMGEVARFGRWRGAQQTVRPALLTAARALVTAAVGATAYGQLEAARVYVAPALLVVGGMGSLLLPTYAGARDRPIRSAIRKAGHTATLLLAGSLALGALATLAVPLLGPIVTGGHYHLSALAVLGWTVYAASTATVTPYGSLAAVRGRQAMVLVLRVTDSAISLGLTAGVLFALKTGTSLVPFALAAGSFAGGLLLRRFALRPLGDRRLLPSRKTVDSTENPPPHKFLGARV